MIHPGSQRHQAPPDLAENAGRTEKAWEMRDHEPIIRFYLDGDWLGVPLFKQRFVRYIGRHSAILFVFEGDFIVVAGPGTLRLHSDYCGHRAQDIKPNGKEIISVTAIDAARVAELLGRP